MTKRTRSALGSLVLLASGTFAMCGVKAPPRPPLEELAPAAAPSPQPSPEPSPEPPFCALDGGAP